MKSGKIIIRKAHYADIHPMTGLLAELFAIEKDFTFDARRHARALEMLFNDPRALLLVAKDKNSVMGMVSMQELISSAEGGRVGLIEDFVIAREYRGKGIGMRLLETLFAEASKAGLTRVQLAADRYNDTALNFYAKHGFKQSSMQMLYRKASVHD